MAEKANSKITSCTQNAKYFSTIANCTPDSSHVDGATVFDDKIC
jgi:hypothetical protein